MKYVPRLWEINSFTVLVGKSEGKRPLRGPRCILEDKIKFYLKKIGYKSVDCIHVAQDKSPLVGSSDRTRRGELAGSMKGGEFFNYPNYSQIL